MKIKSLITACALTAGTLVAMAMPASAHISKCDVNQPPPPSLAGGRFVGGMGGFECDRYGNHHTFVELKTEVQVLTVNLPGTRFDQWRTVIEPNGLSPRRTRMTITEIDGIPALAPCIGQTNTYRIRDTLAVVGAHGVLSKTKASKPKRITCPRVRG